MSPKTRNASSSPWRLKFRALVNGFWTLIVGLSVVLGIVTAFIVFRSDVTFEEREKSNPDDVFSTPFFLSNEGSFSIKEVELSCQIDYLKPADGGREVKKQKGCIQPKELWTKFQMDARGKQGFRCLAIDPDKCHAGAGSSALPYLTAEITLRATYRPYFWLERQKSQTFEGDAGQGGIVATWLPGAQVEAAASPSNTAPSRPAPHPANPSGAIFQDPVNYISENAHPNSVALGDFNGDGRLDLVSANSSTNTVGVRLGNADGTFQAEKTYLVSGTPYSVIVADFNLDGKLDVAVSDFGAEGGQQGVEILLGNGDGTFKPATRYYAGDQPTQLAVADFNKDGKPDIAVTNRTQETVTVLLGNGDGSFQSPKKYPVGRTPIFVAVGDFNLDGKTDMVVANNGDNSLSVLLGNGDGTFQDARPIKEVDTGVYGPYSVVVADLNGDNKPDLAVANFSEGTVRVLLGNGDGTFQEQEKEKHVYPTGDGPFTLAQGYFLGDKKLDLVTANNSNTVSILLGNGDGTFQPVQNYKAGYSPASVAVGDFNGDGKPDLAVANRGDSTVSVLLNISNR